MKKILIAIIIAAIVLSSCSTVPPRQPDRSQNYYEGFKGVDTIFTQGAPPRTIFEDTNFSVNIQIHNRGAHTIPENSGSKIKLSLNEFYLTPLYQKEEINYKLEGKSRFYPQGEDRVETIAALRANELRSQMESPKTTIYATICYPYKTTATGEVCIDRGQYTNDQREKVCSVQDLSFNTGQGAPVAIKSVEVFMEQVAENRVRPKFKVNVENTGGGSVLKPYVLGTSACSEAGSEENSKVTITGSLSGNIPLECEPEQVKLINGKGFTLCTIQGGGILGESQEIIRAGGERITYTPPLTYQALIAFELGYVYTNTISRDLEIMRTG